MKFLFLSAVIFWSGCGLWARTQSVARAEREQWAQEAEKAYKIGDMPLARAKWGAALGGGATRAQKRRWRPAMARTYEAEGDYQKALAAFQEAYDADPKNVDRLADLGRVYDAVEMEDESMRYYEMALARARRRRDVQWALGRLRAKVGQWKAAYTLIADVVRADPRDDSAQLLMSQIQEGLGDLAAAAEHRQAAVDARPTPDGYMALGRLWARQDRWEQAAAAFRAAQRMAVANPEPEFELAVLAWRQGNVADAEAALIRCEKAAKEEYPPARFLRALMALEKTPAVRRDRAEVTRWLGEIHE